MAARREHLPLWTRSDRCAAGIRLGRKSKAIKGSRIYDVCLSPSQAKKLFGPAGVQPPIGCGTFACAFPVGQKVVKLTADREDLEGMLATKGSPHVARLYAAYELVNAGRDVRTGQRVPVYALVVERLRPLTHSQELDLWTPIARARQALLHLLKKSQRKGEQLKIAPDGHRHIADFACKKEMRKAKCQPFAEDFVKGWLEILDRGIVWQDAHTGNIAFDDKGHWKAIDLGYSGTRKRTQVPQLKGQGLRRRRVTRLP